MKKKEDKKANMTTTKHWYVACGINLIKEMQSE